MQTKLTLRLDENLIQAAKTYAREADKSLSQIVADYFALLTAQSQTDEIIMASLPPITRSLVGSVTVERAVDDDRYIYLMEKHK
jgi:Family of unknown function (DUF6364)